MENQKEELIALISYLTKHNEEHAKEIRDLSSSLKDLDEAAYQELLKAIQCFDDGNLHLNAALNKIKN